MKGEQVRLATGHVTPAVALTKMRFLHLVLVLQHPSDGGASKTCNWARYPCFNGRHKPLSKTKEASQNTKIKKVSAKIAIIGLKVVTLIVRIVLIIFSSQD